MRCSTCQPLGGHHGSWALSPTYLCNHCCKANSCHNMRHTGTYMSHCNSTFYLYHCSKCHFDRTLTHECVLSSQFLSICTFGHDPVVTIREFLRVKVFTLPCENIYHSNLDLCNLMWIYILHVTYLSFFRFYNCIECSGHIIQQLSIRDEIENNS